MTFKRTDCVHLFTTEHVINFIKSNLCIEINNRSWITIRVKQKRGSDLQSNGEKIVILSTNHSIPTVSNKSCHAMAIIM